MGITTNLDKLIVKPIKMPAQKSQVLKHKLKTNKKTNDKSRLSDTKKSTSDEVVGVNDTPTLIKEREVKTNKKAKLKSKSDLKKLTKKAKTQPTADKRCKTFVAITRPDILHSYLSHNDIMKYLDYIKKRYSNFVKVHLLGYSYEKKPIKGIEINWNSERNLSVVAKEQYHRSMLHMHKSILDSQVTVKAPKQGRNMVFIEGGTHAREWLSIAVALHCIYQLTECNARNRDILRKLRFFIVPLVNPDGYEYTRNINPRWRKNRRPQCGGNIVGADCNRNFNFHWEVKPSRNRRNTYQGDKPFSEPETQTLGRILRCLSDKLVFFLSLHSYATSIMYPWGYTRDSAENTVTLEAVAKTGCQAIKAFNGRNYSVGSIAALSKRCISGSVVDYVYGVVKTPIALVMELPSKEYGFQPPKQIISSLGHESWIGIKEMCRHTYALNLCKSSNVNENVLDYTTSYIDNDYTDDDVYEEQLDEIS